MTYLIMLCAVFVLAFVTFAAMVQGTGGDTKSTTIIGLVCAAAAVFLFHNLH